jgi:hypothetical protein
MKPLIEASELLVDLGQARSGLELSPIVHRYTVNVLAKYFDHQPNFNRPPFGIRLMSAEKTSEYVDLAEDSLMYSSIFRSFTASKLGRGGVRYTLDVSHTSYEVAGMADIACNLDTMCSILCAITQNIDFGDLVALARSGDQSSIQKLKNYGVHIL